MNMKMSIMIVMVNWYEQNKEYKCKWTKTKNLKEIDKE